MPRYKILHGKFVDTVLTPDKDHEGRFITEERHYAALPPDQQGDALGRNVFDCDKDLSVYNPAGMPPKFQLLQEGGGDNSFVFDPQRETIDQFHARVKSVLQGPVTPGAEDVPAELPESRAGQPPRPEQGPVGPGGPQQAVGQPAPQPPPQQPPRPGQPGQQPQPFPRVPGRSPARSKEEYHQQLSTMTVQELKEHADAEEIDLHSARTKDEILKALKDAS